MITHGYWLHGVHFENQKLFRISLNQVKVIYKAETGSLTLVLTYRNFFMLSNSSFYPGKFLHAILGALGVKQEHLLGFKK